MPEKDDLLKIADSINITTDDEITLKEKPIIKVIGVGGGGNNAINYMYNQGINDVTFVVCNTDRQALRNSPVPTKVQLGDGLGAGGDPEIGRKLAEDSTDKIEEIFDDGTKMVFITAGMGGGTGTGAGPVVARIARERGLLTIGIVTIPFLFEGRKKILKALDGADEMAKYVDALLIINNQRITEIYSDLDFLNAFNKADDTLAMAARSISEIITSEGYVNRDFNDVNTILRNGGTAIISIGYGEGENRVTKAIEDALNSPLLRNRDIFGSKKLLFNLYFSKEAQNPFMMGETAEITNFINNIDPTVDVIWGVAIDNSLGDKVKMTILASGFDMDYRSDEAELKATEEKPLAASRKREPERTGVRAETAPFPSSRNEDNLFTVPTSAAKNLQSTQYEDRRLEQEYGSEQLSSMKNSVDKTRYVVLTPEQLENMELIDRLEQTPAYNRDKRASDEIKSMGAERNASQLNSAPGKQGNVISF